MGWVKAPYFRGEFFVIGGETTSGQVPNGVYNRVDVYNPITKSWRVETNLPTARHGISPIVYDGRIFVMAGGITEGVSASAIVEVFRP